MKIDLVGLPVETCSGIARCEKNLVGLISKKVQVEYFSNNQYLASSSFRRYYCLFKTLFFGFSRSERKDTAKIIHIMDQNSAWILPFFRTNHPIIVTVYDLFMYDNPDNLPMTIFEKLKYKLIFSAIKKADALTTISEYTKAELVKKLNYPAEKISVVYEGINPAIFKQVKKGKKFLLKYGIPEDKKIVLNVGTEIPRKNIPLLIRAFKLLHDKDANTILVKIGHPLNQSYRDENKRLVGALGLDRSVFFIDNVDDVDLVNFYSVSSVVVSPSLREGGFALPLLEAMACGCPVVYSNIPPLVETVGDCGVCANPEDPASFAEAILKVLNDKKLVKQLMGKALLRVKNFTWENSAKRLLKVYADFYAQLVKD